MGSFLLVFGWIVAASNAVAAGIPGPQAPDVFSGDFGITLAKGMADGQSVLDEIDTTASYQFPWGGGFVFPVSLPSLPDRPAAPSGIGSDLDSAGTTESGARNPVPEPAPAVLMALGLAAIGAARRVRSA